MTTRHQALAMDELCRRFRHAEVSLVLEDKRRIEALKDARRQIDIVLYELGRGRQ